MPTFLCFKYDLVRASRIVAVAVCLRNVAITLKKPKLELDDELPFSPYFGDGPENVIFSIFGQTTMQAIIANYFCDLISYASYNCPLLPLQLLPNLLSIFKLSKNSLHCTAFNVTSRFHCFIQSEN